jgi:hypothetical protein
VSTVCAAAAAAAPVSSIRTRVEIARSQGGRRLCEPATQKQSQSDQSALRVTSLAGRCSDAINMRDATTGSLVWESDSTWCVSNDSSSRELLRLTAPDGVRLTRLTAPSRDRTTFANEMEGEFHPVRARDPRAV